MNLRHFALSHVGAVRSENQDSVYVLPEAGVFMVADGMGGEKAGAEASAQVVNTVNRIITESFVNKPPVNAKSVANVARSALEIASNEVYQISVREPEKAGLGSTGSLLILHRGAFFAAQVGDSRIYLVRKSNARQITRDHTVVWTLYENGILTRDQLETHPERHLLTQCIGGAKPVEVDIFSERVEVGDLFLICSDGLTGYAGESEVLKLLLDPVYNMEERGYKLLQAALQGGGGDNISIVLIRVESLDPAKDNWNPETASNPSMPKPQMIPPMPTPASTVDPSQVAGSKSRTGLIAALTLILLVGILLFVLINRGGKVAQVVLDGIPNINEAEITLLDSVGQPLPEIEVDRDGDLLTLHLTKNAEYILEIKGPGIVPVRTSVDFTHNTGKPIKITIKEMARVSIQVPPGSAIASLKIISDPANGGKTVYEYPNNKDAAPKLELEIMPEVPYQVSIEDTAGKIFSNQINVAPGGTEFVNMQF